MAESRPWFAANALKHPLVFHWQLPDSKVRYGSKADIRREHALVRLVPGADIHQKPSPLPPIIHSNGTSELAIERIYFLLDIMNFRQRPEPRSSKHESWIEQFQSGKSW